jgi:DNA-directed RNA polymerase specialized sigma24 family protein
MASAGSVTHWVRLLKAGDADAAQKLWEEYFAQLVRLARKKLQNTSRAAASAEDVALSAFDSFCRGAEHGRFPQLHDRHDLWQLLVLITVRKAFDAVQYERRQKRRRSAAARPPTSAEARPDLERVIGREPSPEFAAQVAEECRVLLARLGDAELQAVAVWKMEGYSNAEIAAKLGCVPRTVERKLRVIRSLWGQERKP